MNFMDGYSYYMNGSDGERIRGTGLMTGTYSASGLSKLKGNLVTSLMNLHSIACDRPIQKKSMGQEVVVTCQPDRVVKSIQGAIVINEVSDVTNALLLALIHQVPQNPVRIDPNKKYTAQDLADMGYDEYFKAVEDRMSDLSMMEIDASLSPFGDLAGLKISHNWSDDQLANIDFHLTKFGDYKVTDLVVEVAKWLQTRSAILLSGGTSVGKTTTLAKVSTILGLPFYYQQFDKGMDVDRFMGTYVPDENGNGFKKVYSQAVLAFKNGGLLVLDEVNTVSGDFTTVLHPMLDEQGIMVLPDGEKIYRHPLFRLAGGVNEKYSGTKPLNVAFLRRFGRKIRVKPMDEGTMKSLAVSKYENAISSGQISEDDIVKAISCAKAIEEFYITERIREAGIGITHVYNFLDLLILSGDAKMSAIETLVNTSCENEETNVSVETAIIPQFYQ